MAAAMDQLGWTRLPVHWQGIGFEAPRLSQDFDMTEKANPPPAGPAFPRPPDIVLPMGQPVPPGPGLAWWIRKIMDRK
jgi:hypothetical protein